MFSYCSSLTSVPLFDTSNVTNMGSTFERCTTLVSLPLFDFSKVTSIIYIFGTSDLTNLTNIGGFKNLGMQPTLNVNSSFGFNKAPNMTHESIMNIINNLYDRKSAGYSVVTLKLATKTLALLSEDEIAIATNKGWTIS
jgi:surface protein